MEIKKTNAKIAKIIGINPAARTSCIKPAGTTSCVLGTASGIHPHHAKRYIRRVQANKLEFPAQYFKSINPLAVEDSVWSANGTDVVLSFLCEVPVGAITKNNLSATELLDKVKLTQQNWVEAGTNKHLCRIPSLRHNVSNTITVKPDEWDDVEQYIYQNRKWFAGISLLPYSGDKDYPQAPFTTILDEKELAREYGKGTPFASGLIVAGLEAFNNNLWAACDCALGQGEELPDIDELDPGEPNVLKINSRKCDYEAHIAWLDKKSIYDEVKLKYEWVRRLEKFANNYFEGDNRRATYCLKDVHNWKLWCDLSREYKEVDWDSVIEEDEFAEAVDTMGAQACSGGACEINF